MTVTANNELDQRDRLLLAQRRDALERNEGPRVGDYVDFADGVQRRISHIWGEGWDRPGAQTSDGGSFYLGDGYVSFSGGLHPLVPFTTLTLTEERRAGAVWFFHHDYATAHNGIGAVIPFRVYSCAVNAPR